MEEELYAIGGSAQRGGEEAVLSVNVERNVNQCGEEVVFASINCGARNDPK